MREPKIVKIVVNMGVGELSKKSPELEKASSELAAITGQKPAIRTARISVAGFNIRRGMPVGLKITLRGKRALDFLKKLIRITFPRLRDFRGVEVKSFDKSGNYTLGISDHTVFTEIDIGKIDKPKGLEITIVTDAGNPEKGKELLEKMGMPFAKEKN